MFSPIRTNRPFAIKQGMVRSSVKRVILKWCWPCGNAQGKQFNGLDFTNYLGLQGQGISLPELSGVTSHSKESFLYDILDVGFDLNGSLYGTLMGA